MTRDEVMAVMENALDWARRRTLSDMGQVFKATSAIIALYTERDALLTVRETLKREVNALKAEIAARDADLSYTTACATIRKLKAENDRLRAALAHSPGACVYCQLSREEMAKCKAGLPGCPRADDMSGCPEFGAMMESATFRNALEHIAGSCGGRAAEVALAALNGEGHE